MARPPRLQTPGTIHHLIARGNQKRETFLDDTDRQDYLDRLAEYHEQFGFSLYAFCLMPNHVHLAVQQGSKPLWRFMHALQSSYTQSFNRRHGRVGHLFQGRYKSFLVESARYFFALIRYIHRNPVKAGIVSDPGEYQWSSDRFFRSGAGPSWINLDRALSFFAPTISEAVGAYRELMDSAGENDLDYESIVAFGGAVKGVESFAREALREIPRPPGKKAWTAEAVAVSVAESHGMKLADLTRPSRARDISRLRFISAHVAREEFGIPIAESARLFRRDASSMAHGVRHLELRIACDPALRNEIQRIGNNAKTRA